MRNEFKSEFLERESQGTTSFDGTSTLGPRLADWEYSRFDKERGLRTLSHDEEVQEARARALQPRHVHATEEERNAEKSPNVQRLHYLGAGFQHDASRLVLELGAAADPASEARVLHAPIREGRVTV